MQLQRKYVRYHTIYPNLYTTVACSDRRQKQKIIGDYAFMYSAQFKIVYLTSDTDTKIMKISTGHTILGTIIKYISPSYH